ncbi:aminocarboxymuconate-semialdehyde decarboxylase [Streptomyces sp. BK022]|uniref:amidohydrolase family protein n=1 Tax=Streptomyces sp. BK022 TaxID=2512123 RepID=UPI00102A11AA|nr:amidohydrolase family protein [Streptomyces sp. BK022]RZU37513.1 aminocarboxymuconate-semialdehyde decarboxylase [Streptomyces sp. BK022]
MPNAARVDVHTHVVPPFWGDALPSHGGDPSGWATPAWSPEAHLAYMDDQKIATSVLSLTAPSVVGWQGQARRDMARGVNEYVAELVGRYPDRFGNFATVPLPDVEGAVAEAEYALDELGADGVVLLSNYEGVYLGDARYAPLWEALNRRSAVVFIHPGHPLVSPLPEVPGPLVDYPYDTTRNAVQMVFSGVLNRYPDAKIILAHAGGFVPYAVMRFCELQPALDPEGPTTEELLAKFRLFYWDTALSSGPDAFPSFLAFADHERILFGSDFPYAPAPVAAAFNRLLDTRSGLTDEQKTAFDHGNAKRIFGRLA